MSLIRVERQGAARVVTMARPEKRNAINPEMMAELRSVFERAPEADERLAVLRAEGTVFSAGLQLSTSGVEPGEADRIEAMFTAVQNYPLPVVAVVQGPAIAGGCELALHCDFVIADETAPFAMPLAQLGVATTWFLTKKLMETAGAVTTRELLLLGEPLNGGRLCDLGVIARACPADALEATAAEVIDRLSRNAPMSLRTMKAIMLQQAAFYFDLDRGETDALVTEVYASKDAVEGVAAKMERRQASFSGS